MIDTYQFWQVLSSHNVLHGCAENGRLSGPDLAATSGAADETEPQPRGASLTNADEGRPWHRRREAR